jgi:hypothetical protein
MTINQGMDRQGNQGKAWIISIHHLCKISPITAMSHDVHFVSMATALALVFPIVT